MRAGSLAEGVVASEIVRKGGLGSEGLIECLKLPFWPSTGVFRLTIECFLGSTLTCPVSNLVNCSAKTLLRESEYCELEELRGFEDFIGVLCLLQLAREVVDLC